jgi:hypothetical protein
MRNVDGRHILQNIRQLQDRALSGGGFAIRQGGDFRPDATAWAVIALTALGMGAELTEAARQRLAAGQLGDGRVSISPDHPQCFWPTSLAVMAWQGAPAYKTAQDWAISFLLETSGLHYKKAGSIFGHNPDLKGWPWRSDTHSWAEPTAITIMALQVAGYGGHPRLAEARLMLMDRQIPGGGWNYGNTIVFGQILHPMPESTGMVLNALSHKVTRAGIQESLAYLEDSVASLKTPWSLGWALLGLGAWGARPTSAGAVIEACLVRQERFSGYDTSSLALLLLASKATEGLVSICQA